jgi:serine/threonine protein kinase
MSKVAVKIIEKSANSNSTQENLDAMSEFYILKGLSHPSVVRVREIYENESAFFIVMDCIHGGIDLAKHLFQRNRNELASKALVYKIFTAI